MARVDDKARFYLERTVPQLREFESKEIFTKDEIRTLVRKRTDFERLILSPGSQPSDFLTYIAWEQSLENLRAKRCLRLRIKKSTGHSGQARILQTFERGVNRHPGSAILWRRYLEYAAQVKATKQWRRIMTRALRMLPSDAELWVKAGRKAAEDGDMDGARGYFMRGCRFCTADVLVWTEYARVEMQWLAKLEKKKGTAAFPAAVAAVAAKPQKNVEGGVYEEGEGFVFDEDGDDDGDDGAGEEDDNDFSKTIVSVRKQGGGAAAAQGKTTDLFNQDMVKKLEASPALDGAIPLAIFDVAQAQPFFGPAAAEAFFDMFAVFTKVSAQARINDHVMATMDRLYPQDPATWNCHVKRPLLGLNPDAPTFPRALRVSLEKLREGLENVHDRAKFAAKCTAWIDVLLAKEDLDDGLRVVLNDTRKKLERA
ncbi:U3 small nucleolar RNA-associated protein 6 [Niveomyces insectorum RCEF 264]|uniref:U3 small nucleolar RNA-associated protein 6 n=1 Tax=Niveomyces insectorum RCEF 264 TaxID=1081102 RepID=A0A167XT50_9HYPO|nr:U3 small nucleolar RNA-associated protein 6 [Niveomyces insectorum RCEF 264]